MVSVYKYPAPPSQLNYDLDSPSIADREVFQHGSIGEFITSGVEGVQSGFIRCIYRAKNDPDHTVTLLCEKIGGCCVSGCCPKDQFWMTGLIVLLVFVLIVFCIGATAMIFCYQRSKNRERNEQKDRADYRPSSEIAGHNMGGSKYLSQNYQHHDPQNTLKFDEPYNTTSRHQF